MAVHKWRRRQTKHFGEVWFPFAHIEIQAADGRFQALALHLDSGAVVSLLRRSVADLLGIDLESGRKIELTSVGGASTTAYVHELTTRLADNIVYPVPFAISTSEAVPNLLGRLKVFDLLQVDFDATLQETQITPLWLDGEQRRIWEFLIDTEKRIIDGLQAIDHPEHVRKVIKYFIDRGDQLLVAAMGLLKLHRSYIGPAVIRPLFELALQFEYLMKDPVPRAQQYLDFTHVTRHKQSKAITENPTGTISRSVASSLKREEGEARNKEQFDRVRPQFVTKNKKTGRDKLWGHWYGPSVYKLAADVERLGEYKVWYAMCSTWAHGDPFSTQQTLPYDGKESQIVFFACAGFYSRMLLCVSERMNVILTADQYKALKELVKDWS